MQEIYLYRCLQICFDNFNTSIFNVSVQRNLSCLGKNNKNIFAETQYSKKQFLWQIFQS